MRGHWNLYSAPDAIDIRSQLVTYGPHTLPVSVPVQYNRGMSKPSANGENGRDASGRFAKGNAGGLGNPFARRVSQLRSLIVEELADDDLQAIVRRMVDDAKAGDKAAAKLLLSYAIGKPAEPVCGPDHAEAHELDAEAAKLNAERRRELAGPSELDGMLGRY